uniref:Uncharacterized protein n=1 Tax=Rhizophora mucronata TaxID=61149 RepID=A0A2P2PC72_RHIMU
MQYGNITREFTDHLFILHKRIYQTAKCSYMKNKEHEKDTISDKKFNDFFVHRYYNLTHKPRDCIVKQNIQFREVLK